MRQAAFVLLIALAGCATPVGVRRLGRERVFHDITASAVEDGVASQASRSIVDRHGLLEQFEKDPPGALRTLDAIARTERRGEYFAALAELSFLTAVGLTGDEAKPWYLASLVYAYRYLFDDQVSGNDDPFDPRFRVAADVYNAALTEFLRNADGDVTLASGVYESPFGTVTMEASTAEFPAMDTVARLVPAMDYELRGLRVRNRRPGLGVPLIAIAQTAPGESHPNQQVQVTLKRAATAILHLAPTVVAQGSGRIQWKGRLDLLDPRAVSAIDVAGATVPLEADLSAPLAYALNESDIWKFEVKGLFSSETTRYEPGIYMLEPYKPGKIPVVFVHGTASGPARWADTFNSLEAHRELRENYQYWFFIYTTGNPIVYSANVLRQSLKKLLNDLDPAGNDAALRQMVVVGHSQGGLLTRLIVVDSGTRIWDRLLERGLEPSHLSPENQELLKELLIFERLPFVSCVIFMATPHRGSFLAARWYSKLGSSMISLPGRLADVGKDILSGARSLKSELGGRIPTSLDNMDPSSTFVRELAGLPIHPEVLSHSIIAVAGKGPIEKGNDGVVEYKSAHLEGVESEIVVPSPHSCQAHPLTVQEVRRILREHLKAVRRSSPATPSGADSP